MGYERGDGRDALFARMCRKLDLAARHKLNVVWFDGFGWNPDRRAGYAEFARALARRARELGIRLAHAGYGGGYGFAYQASDIYSAPYMGRVFENRRPWPNGELYPCLGHPLYERSWTWGTCLSNDELLAAKLDELTAFVRACEPGLLYIHDLDTGDWQPAVIAWARRCDQCRRRWPNDQVTAPDGMAGAYARWFRMVADAVSAIRSDDGEYHAARDCELVFVGPIYTNVSDSPEVWAQEVAYFQLLSELIGPAQNIQFGIREQGVSGLSARPRVAELAERLDMVGNGHGVLVINFSGGDAYYNDQLISPAAALSPLFLGARTFYTVHLGSVAEPAQLIAAELGWNTAAPSAFTIPSTQEETHELMRQLRLGSLRPDAVFGTGGLLQRACALLYGPCAGPLVARALASDEWGGSPVATICRSVPRAIQRLLANKDWDGSDILEGWRARADASRQAADLVAQALDCRDLPPGAAEDLRWLHGCLQVGAQFAEALVVAHLLAARRRAEFADRLSALCAELRRQVQEDFPTDIFDPVGGEMALWLVAIDELEELADAYRSRGWV